MYVFISYCQKLGFWAEFGANKEMTQLQSDAWSFSVIKMKIPEMLYIYFFSVFELVQMLHIKFSSN